MRPKQAQVKLAIPFIGEISAPGNRMRPSR
jgi:hypothetical protein